MLEIVTDKAFVSLTLAAAVLGTIVSGFSTFGPKFIESQFRKSPADAANVFGNNFCVYQLNHQIIKKHSSNAILSL